MSDWIVVVDDDITILKVASQVLAAKRMRVSALKSGEELLEFLGSNHPDLILLDIHMEGMDGFETLAVIKSRPKSAGIPVIFLTGDEDTQSETKGLVAGAMDFLRKPFSPEVLLQRVRHTIELSKLQSNLESEVEKKTAEILAQHERIKGLKRAAETDQMTGLLNKGSAQDEIGTLCRQTYGVLMMLDLDSFKLVNDLYGHSMGDKLLVHFAKVIRSVIRSTDIAGRMGGDEFVTFCAHIREESVIHDKVNYINERIIEYAHEILGDNMTIPLGVSVGAVMVPDEGKDFLTLYQKADEALYTVKQNGKHGCAFYWENKHPKADPKTQEKFAAMAILRERNKKDGGYIVGFEQFRILFRFLVRVQANYPLDNFFILFTINGDEDKYDDALDEFMDTASRSLRTSDVLTKNGRNQCMILLLLTTQEESESVIDRIISSWNAENPHPGLYLEYESEWVQ